MTGLTCPSAPAEPGALLLGIRGPQGRIVPLRTPMPVDTAFLDAAGPAPEARMRFAAPCQTTGCAQWQGGGCGVIRRVLDHLATTPEAMGKGALPPCLIRHTCRWFREQGGRACHACDLVVTDQAALAG